MPRLHILLQWITFLVLFGVGAWLIGLKSRKLQEDRILANGTEHLLHLWQDAIQQYAKETGEQPDECIMPYPSIEYRDSRMVDIMFGGNPLGKMYLHAGATNRNRSMQPTDGWHSPLVFDPERKGDLSVVVSAGPDRIHGTADDLHSRNARKRDIPTPKE